MRRLLLAAVASAIAAFSPAAKADLYFRAFVDEVFVPGSQATSSTGVLSAMGTAGVFSFYSGLSLGSPLLAQPAFDSQTTAVSSLPGFTGTHTIRFEFTQTDVMSASVLSGGDTLAEFASTFVSNALINGGFISSVVLATYVDAANTAFSREQLLSSVTYTSGPTNDSGALIGTAQLVPGGLFSETTVIEATFTGPGATLNASAQIAAVPEPASLAILGAGLLGLGLTARRRQQR